MLSCHGLCNASALQQCSKASQEINCFCLITFCLWLLTENLSKCQISIVWSLSLFVGSFFQNLAEETTWPAGQRNKIVWRIFTHTHSHVLGITGSNMVYFIHFLFIYNSQVVCLELSGLFLNWRKQILSTYVVHQNWIIHKLTQESPQQLHKLKTKQSSGCLRSTFLANKSSQSKFRY